MKIRNIGNYTILKTPTYKQIYSQNRMLQISNSKVYYVDLLNNKLLRTGERVMKWVKR